MSYDYVLLKLPLSFYLSLTVSVSLREFYYWWLPWFPGSRVLGCSLSCRAVLVCDHRGHQSAVLNGMSSDCLHTSVTSKIRCGCVWVVVVAVGCVDAWMWCRTVVVWRRRLEGYFVLSGSGVDSCCSVVVDDCRVSLSECYYGYEA